MRNPYDVLELPRNEWVPLDEIKTAFRRLAMQYHPDRNNGSKTLFQELNWAYSLLSDEYKKNRLDRWGEIDEEDCYESNDPLVMKFKAKIKERFEEVKANIKEEINQRFENLNKMLKQVDFSKEDYRECYICGGEGIKQQSAGFFNVVQKCDKCKGEGFIKFTKIIPAYTTYYEETHPKEKPTREVKEVDNPQDYRNVIPNLFSKEWWFGVKDKKEES